MLPENQDLKSDAIEEVKIDNKGNNDNLISAISQGANDGLNMALGIGASLIAILSIVALINGAIKCYRIITRENIIIYICSNRIFNGIRYEVVHTCRSITWK